MLSLVEGIIDQVLLDGQFGVMLHALIALDHWSSAALRVGAGVCSLLKENLFKCGG
jgi:hypothetical protein